MMMVKMKKAMEKRMKERKKVTYKLCAEYKNGWKRNGRDRQIHLKDSKSVCFVEYWIFGLMKSHSKTDC